MKPESETNEHQVADNWEEEDDSDAEREKAARAAAEKAKAEAEAAANKKPKSQRIEEHREANQRRRAQEEDDESSEEDEADKRARLRQTEQEADLKHAQDLLDAGMRPKSRTVPIKAAIIEDQTAPGQTIDLAKYPLFSPSTKGQFDALSATLVPLLTAASSKPHYSLWVSGFVKQICAELPSAEIKKAASALTALSNEKMKEEKDKEKGGKKSKAAKSKTTLAATRDIGRGVADTKSYNDDLGDDDFM